MYVWYIPVHGYYDKSCYLHTSVTGIHFLALSCTPVIVQTNINVKGYKICSQVNLNKLYSCSITDPISNCQLIITVYISQIFNIYVWLQISKVVIRYIITVIYLPVPWHPITSVSYASMSHSNVQNIIHIHLKVKLWNWSLANKYIIIGNCPCVVIKQTHHENYHL